jgi:DNA-binding NarL/FixJ family response regulator
VVVGEDNPILARGLEELIAEHPEMVVKAVAGDRDSLIAAITRHDPDVVVSDLRMPPTGVDEGLQVLRHIEANRMRSGFILFSQYKETGVVAEVLAKQERGRGYLLKDSLADADEMRGAIRAVASGNTVVDPSLVASLMNQGLGPDPLGDLSRRQREVLTLIAEGLSNEGIAERLNITPAAVEKRVTSLFKSLALDDSRATNRRVAATLLYLSSRGVSTD